VVDPRTTSPLDTDTILECIEETGRLVVVDEAHPRCSMASDIAGLAAQNVFSALKAPIQMVTAPHAPVPFSPDLEDLYIPNPAKIEAAVRKTMAAERAAAEYRPAAAKSKLRPGEACSGNRPRDV
jgi:pyruvate dehydrogenase E1 component beta subunit